MTKSPVLNGRFGEISGFLPIFGDFGDLQRNFQDKQVINMLITLNRGGGKNEKSKETPLGFLKQLQKRILFQVFA